MSGPPSNTTVRISKGRVAPVPLWTNRRVFLQNLCEMTTGPTPIRVG